MSEINEEMTGKNRLDTLLSSGLTYSSDVVANLLNIDEGEIITLARRHGFAYRMVEWNDDETQCLRFGTAAEKDFPPKFSAGVAISASTEDVFWLGEIFIDHNGDGKKVLGYKL